MAKFKMRMKLTGFEIELEGERTDVPLMAANMGQQIAQLLQPGAQIIDGEAPRKAVPNVAPLPESQIEDKSTRSRGRRGSNGGARSAATPIAVPHDASKWGNPRQTWNPTKKAIWLLHVVEAAMHVKELSAPEIAATFNAHFKQFGKIQPSNVSRDLNKLKSGATALFVEDVGAGPLSKWSLTAKGRAEAQRLIAEALAPETAEAA